MAYNESGMGIPSIPPAANLEEQRDCLRQIRDFLKNLHVSGLQVTQLNQSQLDEMVTANDLAQVGKLFYDLDATFPGNLKIGMLDGGTLVIKTVTVT